MGAGGMEVMLRGRDGGKGNGMIFQGGLHKRWQDCLHRCCRAQHFWKCGSHICGAQAQGLSHVHEEDNGGGVGS